MTSDDLDLESPAAEEYPDDCARGLRKYLFVMAVIVVGTLAGTFWYRSLGPGAVDIGLPVGGAVSGAALAGGGAASGFGGGFDGAGRPVAVLAAAPGRFPDFAAVVSSLRGTVVSVGRSRTENRFGFNRAGGGGEGGAAAGQPAAGGGDGALQFAVPAAGGGS